MVKIVLRKSTKTGLFGVVEVQAVSSFPCDFLKNSQCNDEANVHIGKTVFPAVDARCVSHSLSRHSDHIKI